MAEAGPDAEADKGVTLVGRNAARALGQQQAVEEGDEAGGASGGGSDGGGDEGRGANGGAKDGVASSDRRAVTAEHGVGAGGERQAEVAEGEDTGEEGDGGGVAEGARSEAQPIDRGLTPTKGETSRGKGDGAAVGHTRRRGNERRHDLGSNVRRAKDVDVVAIRYNDAAVAKEGLEGKEEGLEAEAEELGSQRAPLAGPAARDDDLWRSTRAADV